LNWRCKRPLEEAQEAENEVQERRKKSRKTHPFGRTVKAGELAFIRDERATEHLSRKLSLPFAGPYRVTEVKRNVVTLTDGQKEIKTHLSKTVAIREWREVVRDLHGKRKESKQIGENTDGKNDQDLSVLDISEVRKLIEKLQKQRNQRALIRFARRHRIVSQEAEDKSLEELQNDERQLKKWATQRILAKKPTRAEELKPGQFVIAHVMKQNRLAEVTSVRNVEGDPKPWIRIHILASLDPISMGGKRKFEKLFINEFGQEVLSTTAPKKSKTWWADIYDHDITIVLEKPLTSSGNIHPEDWQRIQKDFSGNLQVLALGFSGGNQDESVVMVRKRRKLN
jgi:hypothetical protein